MGYSLGLLPGPHDPSTQRLPRHVTSLAAISHSAKPSVQRGSCAWLAITRIGDSSPRAFIHSALVSSQNQLSSEPDLPPPAPGVSRRGRLLPNEAPFPFLAPGLGFGGAPCTRHRTRGHSATDPSIHTQRRSGPCCLSRSKPSIT